jgi:hypothetical protein
MVMRWCVICTEKGIQENICKYSSQHLWTQEFCTLCCQHEMLKMYDSLKYGTYSGCCDPGINTWRVSIQVGVTHFTVWRVLLEQQLYPYRLKRVLALSLKNYHAQVMFSQWFFEQCGTHPNIPTFVIQYLQIKHSSHERESGILAFKICGLRRLFHHITNNGSPVTSKPVFVVIIYLHPTYFQTSLQDGITKLS